MNSVKRVDGRMGRRRRRQQRRAIMDMEALLHNRMIHALPRFCYALSMSDWSLSRTKNTAHK